jgi:hypothetical protein
MSELHAALKTEVVARANIASAEFAVARLQDSKTSERWTLHARPGSYTTAGWQTTDVLGTLGFRHSRCNFVTGEQCYARMVPRDFSLDTFAPAFETASRRLLESVRHLEACGLGLEQPEGWTFFTGRSHDRSRRRRLFSASDDGHTSPERHELKRLEDEAFIFALTYIKGGRDRGWVTHYRPKHPPLSSEITAALDFLALRGFQSCPEFDFEPCRWRFVPKGDDDEPFDQLTMWAHRWFDAHPQNFSPAIEKLLAAQAAVAPFDMSVFPNPRGEGPKSPPPVNTSTPGKPAVVAPSFRYDVAISFSGTNRDFAERIAVRVRNAGFHVFYDNFYPEALWGKDLAVFFDNVFRRESRRCLVLISREYLERPWTEHERRSAMARMVSERGSEYLLPVQIDPVELPGLAPTIGYLSADHYSAEEIADLLINKLRTGR